MDQPTSDLLFRLRQIRLGGAVERCHAIPHHGTYSNAAHQWGVVVLLDLLWPSDFARLARLLLYHDIAEAWVGDIPAPVMRFVPGLDRLKAVEAQIVADLGLPTEHGIDKDDYRKFKACDWLEFYMWCLDQRRLGNINVDESIKELSHFIDQVGLPAPADALWAELKQNGIPAKASGVIREAVEKL